MKSKPQAMTEIKAERSHFAFESDLGSLGQLFGGLVRADARFEQCDRIVHPLARAFIRVALWLGGAADREGAVIASAVSDEGMNDVEVCLIARPDEPVGEVVRMRAAALTRYRVDGLDAIRAHFIQTLRRQRNDLAFLHARLQFGGNVVIDAIHHAGCDIEQRDFVVALDLARRQHHLLAVTNFDAFLLQRKQHRRLAHIEAERQVPHAFFLQNLFDLFGRLLEEPDFGTNCATHSGIPGKHVILTKPWTVDSVMTRGRSEIPNPWLAVSRQETVPD